MIGAAAATAARGVARAHTENGPELLQAGWKKIGSQACGAHALCASCASGTTRS